MIAMFAEIKRRNVVRIAGLYLVAAWFLTQVTSTLLPAFKLDPSILRTMVIVLALAFLPVLAFAWAFELTPDGLQRTDGDAPEPATAPRNARWMNRLFLVLLLLSAGYFLVDKFVLSPRRDAALVTATTKNVKAEVTTQAEQQRRDSSIAVLPFVNMSDDKSNQYFSDGISEELLNVLLRVPDLSVASRTSSFAYRDQAIGTLEIARKLKVGHILEGSVRKSGNTVRVTAQLIDAANDRHLWSETYDRELTDIFAIQDEIAQAIVAALSGMLAAPASEKPSTLVQADTSNMQAYDLYLKARGLFVARSDIAESVRLFEQVVRMDPLFARGWEGLAAASIIAPGWEGADDRDFFVLAKQAAQRALELDASLSLPYSVLAKVEEEADVVNWDEVVALNDRAVKADEKNTTAYLWRGQAWWSLGYFDKAVTDMDRCLAIDPAYANCMRWKAQVLISAGDDAQGLALFEKGVSSGFVWNRIWSFVPALVRRGDTLAASLLLDRALPAEINSILMKTLAMPNTQHAGAAALVKRHAGTFGIGQAVVLMYLGDFDAAAAAAIKDGSLELSSVAWQPGQDAWRNSPAFKRVVNASGVTSYWRRHGYPKQCRALGANDFWCD